MRHATVTLELADAYNVILEENADPLLTELDVQLVGEQFAAKVALSTIATSVTLSTIAPSVALVLRRNA